ncbi:hypothetical protein BT69DRAFT_1236094 [Atractiella rhizophila]|nr:hypothetical protein BT69DRAFT_1236094 [Atractiella rhizophila]
MSLPPTASANQQGKSTLGRRLGKAIGVRTGTKEREEGEEQTVKCFVTRVAVCCRRRLVVFAWRDGEWAGVSELALPHQVRSLTFPTPTTAFLGFSTSEYGLVTIPPPTHPTDATPPPMTLGDLFAPSFPEKPPIDNLMLLPGPGLVGSPPSTIAALIPPAEPVKEGASTAAEPSQFPGLGRLGLSTGLGLGGFVEGLGGALGRKGKVAKNPVVKSGMDDEVAVLKENILLFFSSSSNQPRKPPSSTPLKKTTPLTTITYPVPPEEIVVSYPYILALIPTIPERNVGATIHVHEVTALEGIQVIPIMPTSSDSELWNARLLATPSSASASGKAPILAVASKEDGGEEKLCSISLQPWIAQLDEMKVRGEFEAALRLLDVVDGALVPDKEARRDHLAVLSSLAIFALPITSSAISKAYEAAIELFIKLDTNPAKVVALFPQAISGKLNVEEERWESLFGGRSVDEVRAAKVTVEGLEAETMKRDDSTSSSQEGSKRSNKSSVDDVLPDKAAVPEKGESSSKPEALEQKAKGQLPESTDSYTAFRRAVGTLIYYLTDRRQHIAKALAAIPLTNRPNSANPLPPAPPEELFSLPDVEPTLLTPEQLHRVATIVETALFRCYLATKQNSLLGALCRIENWCEVEEVEELLSDAKQYTELLFLYRGKNKHDRAIKLLEDRSQDEPDPAEKVRPTIEYLHKLGRSYLDLILETSKWVYKVHPPSLPQIFVTDIEEVEGLPRHAVAAHLASLDPNACASYLEHIIDGLGEGGPEFHDQLVEIYMRTFRESKETEDESRIFQKLIGFLNRSNQYRPERLLGRLPSDSMFEIRAILLGRLGQHDAALQIYVYRLQAYIKAEQYCKKVYLSNPSSRNTIFITLLNLYLRPKSGLPLLLAPALDAISRQGMYMDSAQILEMLPPLVPLKDVHIFLQKAIRKARETKALTQVQRSIYRTRTDQLDEELVTLEERRVTITDYRVCPVCSKRLGNSVIAIHAPDGIVTHYQCKDVGFSLYSPGRPLIGFSW